MTTAVRTSPSRTEVLRAPRVHAVPLRTSTWVALAVASLVGLAAFGWPLVVAPEAGLAHAADAPVVLGAVLAGLLLVVHLALADGGMDVKAVALLGLLSAVGAVLRQLSAGAAGIELVFAALVLGGRVLGPGFGFALGTTTLATSALLTGGVGPWLPFQMLAASWVGLGAGLLPSRVGGRREVTMLAAYGAVASLAFGVAMNLSFWPYTLGAGTDLSFVAGAPVLENLRRLLLFSAATSLGWDLGRAVTTAVGLALVGAPVLAVLRRTATRAAFLPAPERAGDTSR
ncbi:ECF transporter S component [Actinotalea sp. M2MS4P-6]|uniref:ECF transporter S component n=1 Tax=Actinotalea sp. M2MS4P-6 TaxID=2983762 RepID=UPI0021E3B7BF|nr:ECF transporter S component [Actinotalea sp. M2MS4P-6]MCV2394642.1 ECF transporter S component [Actinotalea sp. M2MS4P-6]